MKATYTKLKDGSWGVRVVHREKARRGEVDVTKKDGSTRVETITQVLWSGPDRADPSMVASLCAIEGRERGSGRGRGGDMCQNCDEYRAVTTAIDMSGCEGRVCRICANSGRMGISFG